MDTSGPQDAPTTSDDPYELRDVDGDGDKDFKDAAILAEFEVDHDDSDPDKAWHRAMLRLGRICLGFILIVAGIIMLVIPGPGVVAILAGFTVWSKDFAFANKMVRFIRRKAPGIDEEGAIPKRTVVITGLFLLAGALGSIWWFGFGGEDWWESAQPGWWPLLRGHRSRFPSSAGMRPFQQIL